MRWWHALMTSSMTALLLRAQANRGHAVRMLGMFEEGFYNRVGFGSGGYEYWLAFDPASLLPKVPYRRPKRLTQRITNRSMPPWRADSVSTVASSSSRQRP